MFCPRAWRGYVAVIKLILDAHAEVNAQSTAGITALHQAASNGQEAVVKMLIDWGADQSILDNDGESAYMQAKENSYDMTAQILKDRGDVTPEDESEGSKSSKQMAVDSALVKLLELKLGACVIKPHGHACSSQSWRLSSVECDATRQYFLKTGTNEDMFRGKVPC